MIDFALLINSLPALLRGCLTSLQIAAVSSLLGITLGTLIGVLDTLKIPILQPILRFFITVVRGTPMLVQILFAFYVLPQLGIHIQAVWAATFAIGINSSAYISQTVRAGIQSVSIGQWEAAQTSGLSRIDTFRYIILPQAFRNVLPSLSNEFITLVKDSSLASVIGVVELSKAGSIIRSQTYDAFTALLAVTLIYLAMTTLLSLFFEKLQKRNPSHA